MKVKVRGISVQVDSKRTRVSFSAGENGPEEAGSYNFWAAFGCDQYGPWTITGRALEDLPPEDRLIRMETERLKSNKANDLHNSLDDREIYEVMWRRLLTIQGIRAANFREVANWMASHRPDAIYAMPDWVCQDKPMHGLPPKAIV